MSEAVSSQITSNEAHRMRVQHGGRAHCLASKDSAYCCPGAWENVIPEPRTQKKGAEPNVLVRAVVKLVVSSLITILILTFVLSE